MNERIITENKPSAQYTKIPQYDPAPEMIVSLSPYRQAKLLRYKMPADRVRCYAAGKLLDEMLIPLGYREAEMAYGENTYGKPFFQNAPELHFSLSHSGGYAMAVLGDTEVGCDIEGVRASRAPAEVLQSGRTSDSAKAAPLSHLTLAKRFFSCEEYEYLAALPEADIPSVFTEIWVLKESLIKADGRGLGCPLDSFSVLDALNAGISKLRTGSISELCTGIVSELTVEGASYACCLLAPPDPGYRAAAAWKLRHP